MLLQFSHSLPITPLHPALPLRPTFRPYSSCPWVLHIRSFASTFPILLLPSPCLFSTYHLCYLFSVPFPPLPLPLPYWQPSMWSPFISYFQGVSDHISKLGRPSEQQDSHIGQVTVFTLSSELGKYRSWVISNRYVYILPVCQRGENNHNTFQEMEGSLANTHPQRPVQGSRVSVWLPSQLLRKTCVCYWAVLPNAPCTGRPVATGASRKEEALLWSPPAQGQEAKLKSTSLARVFLSYI